MPPSPIFYSLFLKKYNLKQKSNTRGKKSMKLHKQSKVCAWRESSWSVLWPSLGPWLAITIPQAESGLKRATLPSTRQKTCHRGFGPLISHLRIMASRGLKHICKRLRVIKAQGQGLGLIFNLPIHSLGSGVHSYSFWDIGGILLPWDLIDGPIGHNTHTVCSLTL